ncbi:serine hydrolase [Sphingomonas sinipercae]|uniref:Serine hydrolase n=1 Tax=Sphingomonas sinipercae TaxID=2714944 RepID=A0A6G7ZKX5_9SPHN|nr:serine hydrolase domain-containing protein [Sphingomonas sinipercae]QIL01634.1 serine hydrolase [Sphingomonas sinipercae]
MRVSRQLAIIILATASVSALARPALAAPAELATGAFKVEADALLRSAFAADGPGGAVIVTRRGKVVYAAARGLADVETRRPLTLDTPFKLGSIVKQFTAATVLQLVAEGKVSLDDPISRFLPDFPEPAARATVRQLLNHSSGINDYSKIPGWITTVGRRPHTTSELVAEVRNRPAKTAPGASWEYNNAGYAMLGAIIEKVTGKAWHEAIAERIARPLGLKSLLYAGGPEANRLMARGYSDDQGRQQRALGGDASVAHAAGGMVASARDLAAWANALHHGRVVSPALYREMVSPARLADGTTRPYGFGLRIQRLLGQRALVHGGAGAGLDTDTAYLPDQDIYVAVLANTEDAKLDASTLSRRLAALAMGQPFPTFSKVDVPLPELQPLFGAYRAKGAPPISFFNRAGKLYLSSGEQEMEAFAAGGDRFFFGPDRLLWMRFLRKPDGAHVMELHEADDAKPGEAVRAGPVPPPMTVPAAILKSYTGTYKTEVFEVTVAMAGDGSLTIAPAGKSPAPMRPVSTTEFRVDAAGFRVVFHPDDGKVDHLTMHRGARELHGTRIAK